MNMCYLFFWGDVDFGFLYSTCKFLMIFWVDVKTIEFQEKKWKDRREKELN
jgi:hypothetical protein